MRTFVVVSLLAVVGLPTVAWGGEEAKESYFRGQIKKGGQGHTFREVVVRDRPSAAAAPVVTLPPACPVTVGPGQDGLNTIRGAGDLPMVEFSQDAWYQVRVAAEGTELTGFVKGEGLSLTSESLPGGLLLLIGHDPGVKGRILDLALYRGSVRSQQTTFEPFLTCFNANDCYSGYVVSSEVLGDKGFGEGCQTVMVSVHYDACGYARPDVVLLIKGTELIRGPVAENVAEAGLFNVSTTFVFPTDRFGKAGELKLVTTRNTEYDEKQRRYAAQEFFSKIFAWDGRRFTEGKEAGPGKP